MRFNNLKFINTKVPAGKQAIINFGTYELSVVQNEASYGSKQGLYEIAVFKNKNQVEMPGITAEGDTVKGYLSEAEVDSIMLKMSFATRTEGKNIDG